MDQPNKKPPALINADAKENADKTKRSVIRHTVMVWNITLDFFI